MITLDRIERLRGEATELGRYGYQMSVVVSLVLSLAAVAILSKNHLTNYLWVNVAAFAIPLPIALYFKDRIVQLGAFPYVSTLILALGAAVMFGI